MFGAEDATETTANSNAKWHFVVTFTGDQNLTLDKIYDAGLRVRIVADITLGGALSNYIEFQDGLSLTVVPSIGGSKKLDMNDNDDVKILKGEYIVAEENIGQNISSATWTFEMGAKTTIVGNDYKNELLKYKTSSGDQDELEVTPPTGKPNATGEPEKMKNALVGANITFNVQAFIEDPNKPNK